MSNEGASNSINLSEFPPEKNWILIGSGTHSTVFLVKQPGDSANPSERKYAVKKIRKDTAMKNREQKIRELEILKKVNHPHIVQFYGYKECDFELHLIMGFVKKGSLSTYVYRKPLELKKIKQFTSQILDGVKYLHDNSIIHRDIKGANILMEDDDNVKITDFGVSKILSELSSKAGTSSGTYNYKAPETFKINTVYNVNEDIWSVGCTVIEMLTGQLPYGVMATTSEMIEKMKKLERPDHNVPDDTPQSLKSFFDKCFDFDPNKRPSADNLLNNDEFLKMPA